MPNGIKYFTYTKRYDTIIKKYMIKRYGMKKSKESLTSAKELKKAIRQGVSELSKEMLLLLFKLGELKDTLNELEKYKANGISSEVEKYERKLKTFDGLIDKKYWNDFALSYIIMALACRVVDTLEEAINIFKNFEKSDN